MKQDLPKRKLIQRNPCRQSRSSRPATGTRVITTRTFPHRIGKGFPRGSMPHGQPSFDPCFVICAGGIPGDAPSPCSEPRPYAEIQRLEAEAASHGVKVQAMFLKAPAEPEKYKSVVKSLSPDFPREKSPPPPPSTDVASVEPLQRRPQCVG